MPTGASSVPDREGRPADRSRRARGSLVAAASRSVSPNCRVRSGSSTPPPRRGPRRRSGNAPSYLPRGGGWLIGIRGGLTGTQRDAALDLAKYLSNPENSNRIRAERSFPMLPFRISQMGRGLPDPTESPDVDSRLWSEAVGRTFAERAVLGLRIPGAEDYLADLAKGRVAALSGTAPAAALADVAPRLDRAHQNPRTQTSALALPPQPQPPGHRFRAPGARHLIHECPRPERRG